MEYIGLVPKDATVEVRCDGYSNSREDLERELSRVRTYSYEQGLKQLNDMNCDYFHPDLFFIVTYNNHPVVSIMDEKHVEIVGIGYITTDEFSIQECIERHYPSQSQV